MTLVTDDPVTHTYYVGDLCYVLNTDQWFTVCAHDFAPDSDGDYDPESFLDPEAWDWENYQAAKPFYIFRTAYGDGCYSDQEGRQYCVDSGTIGCIRTDYADPEKLADAVARGLGHLHEFDAEFNGCGYCGDDEGTLWFDTATGSVEIATAGGWDEDEEEGDDE
jgi:hypothetical protein